MTVKERREAIQELISNKPYDESEFAKYCRRERLKASYEVGMMFGNMEVFQNNLDGTKIEELKEIIDLDEKETRLSGKPYRTAIRKYLRELR